MTTTDTPSTEALDPIDQLSRELQKLRLDAGAVSYGEIANRIVARRVAEGAPAAASRVARSTVYDVFQPGRRRINADLVREIALALGLDAAQADQWRHRCLTARSTAAPPAPMPPRTPPTGQVTVVSHVANTQALRRALITALLVGCLGVNLFGTTLVLRTDLPLFLDMIGTAIAALALGPWYGVAVGVATSVFGMVHSTPETIVFGVAGVVGALLWGYGVRRFARTLPRFLVLNLGVALACTLVSVPLNLLLYGGTSTNASSNLLPVFAHLGLIASVFAVNLGTSVVDKLIAGGLAFFAARWLAPLRLTGAPPVLLERHAGTESPAR